ncbi:helix-turn-helix domain-containing protein [Citrobacter freundii]|uniref:helix-turn-helix domain-containing protein n=1 Tax=Citrobacter freundii TaxID=546 RepID=UPI003899FC28
MGRRSDEHWAQFGAAIKSGMTHREVSQRFGVGMSTLYKKFPGSSNSTPTM